MKKYLILAAAALVASAACSKVDTGVTNTPGNEIKFQAATYAPQTKAYAAETEFTSFSTKAYLHAEGVNLFEASSFQPTSAGGFQNFFGTASAYTETVTATTTDSNSNGKVDAGEASAWTTSQTYYWPKSSNSFINFIGWYGVNSAGSPVAPTVGYAWDADASAYKATLDWTFTQGALGNTASNYLLADMAWRYNENTTNNQFVGDVVTSGVPMLFRHVLSKICVKIYASGTDVAKGVGGDSDKVTDGNAKWAITINSGASLGTVSTSGTLNFSNTDPKLTTENTQAWTLDNTTSSATGSIATSSNCVVNEVTRANAVTLMPETCVLPQTLGGDVTISGNIDIVTTYTNGATNHEIVPFSVTLNSMGTSAWQTNHMYTYYLKFLPSQNVVEFDPAIDSEYTAENKDDKVIPAA